MPVFRLAFLLSALLVVPAAQAAQGYDNCTGFIDSLPVSITSQGTWCLRRDLNTAMTSGAAITVATNNVTLDCNHFKLGGLPAGPGSAAFGVLSANRANVTVRNCTIRGFSMGVWLTGTQGGHLIEDNRFDTNLQTGIGVEGDGSVIRRNQVLDTGASSNPRAIYTYHSVDIVDNTISNVVADPAGNSNAWGIYTVENQGGRVVGNAVRGVVAAGTGVPRGMQNFLLTRMVVRDNDLIGSGSGIGIECDSSAERARNNTILGFGTALVDCADDGNTIAF